MARPAAALTTAFTTLGLALLFFGSGCGKGGDDDGSGDDMADSDTDGESGETGNQTGVTFYEDVAPIMFEHCTKCHTDGGIAPFQLETYDDATTWAELIVPNVEDRVMPPFLMDASGDCNTYLNSDWLTDEQIAVFTNWLADGLLEGDPANAPELPAPPEGLVDATHTIEMAEAYTPDPPQGGPDDYRCFLLDPGLDTEEFMTAYEVVPGDARFVHHVVVFQPTSQAGADQAQSKDDAEDGYGYTCFGDAGLSSPTALVASWAPGRSFWEYPEGTGVRVDPDYPLIVQVHYNVETDPVPDLSAVRMKFSPQVDRPMVSWFLGDFDMVLPGGQEEAWTEVTATPFQMMQLWGVEGLSANMELVGIFPHMHNRGRQFFLGNNSDDNCYGFIPRWDFNWQFPYFFEEPMPLGATDMVRLACSYDTSEDTQPVPWGDGTDDEMCLVGMFTTYEP